jgi:glycosyltransferase involved in cell wall biosynthesis/ubiquinone/menaquinone biosynthesis C-methylase UbiE
MHARVTIAIPCYKQAVFLFECLNSLIAQTLVDWEAFVVDDCSPDSAAAEIVASYDDKRIQYVRHRENRGLAAARNTAIHSGSASTILCLDADDFLHREFLCATLGAMESHSVDCAFTDFQLVGLESSVWKGGVKTLDDLAQTQWIPGSGTIIRRSLWKQVGGYCEAVELRVGNEDWDFWIGAATLGFSAGHVPRPLYFYRRHVISMSKSVLSPIEWRTREFIVKRHPKFFATGDRAKVFRTGGLLRSAWAERGANRRLAALRLKLLAVAIDPQILFTETKSFLRRGYLLVRSLVRRTITQFKNFAAKLMVVDQSGEVADDAPRNWEALAPIIHQRYGYLSHDYPVLSDIIEKTGVRSILEIGCGSGRLVPVYLLHAMNPIWLQDISASALDICRQRFLPQKHIRYFAGDLEHMTVSAKVDLVVSNRVLQFLLDESDFRRQLNVLSKWTRFVYINEATIVDNFRDPYMKGRNYNSIFQSLGFHLRDQGELEAESGARQSWKLFENTMSEANDQKLENPIFGE